MGAFSAANQTCAAPGAASGYTLKAQYLLDAGGDQVTELSGTGAWVHSNVWAGAHLDATYDTKGLHFHLSDPLGTRRVQTNVNGVAEANFQSLPYGDGYVYSSLGLSTCDDATEHHFTSKEHDAESGNDYFQARYYTSSIGRFMSPDWSAKVEPVPYSKMDDPQSLNLYAYVQNNPLGGADPDGHQMQSGKGQFIACAEENPEAEQCGPGTGLHFQAPDDGQTPPAQQPPAPTQQPPAPAQQQNNVSATVPGQNPTNSSGHPIDKDAIANYADQHAENHSLGKCAAYCRRAFEAGGVDTSGHPIDAKDWGPTLLKNGAAVISPDGYTPQKADTAVFAGSDAHPHGHIAVYDGKQWVSDFKQRNMSPYRSGTTSVTIYRFPDN